MLGPKVVTGVYHVPAVDIRTRAVLTNTGTVAPYRGAGRPEAIYLIEAGINVPRLPPPLPPPVKLKGGALGAVELQDAIGDGRAQAMRANRSRPGAGEFASTIVAPWS